MNQSANFDELSEIFLKVAEAPRNRRQALLDKLCPNDDLRHRVLKMLDADSVIDPLLDHALLPTSVEAKPGESIAGYQLVKELAQGGMGVVFLAEQFEPVRRTVALKVIKPGVDTREVIARFDAERQALSMMDHPNIAKVLDGGSTENGRPFFVMELINGQPITEYCENNQLHLNERLKLFVSVCRAIQHAHQKGVIHRDIKPSNVLVAQYDDQPVAKVIDFGVAKAINQSLSDVTVATKLGQLIGTFDYMSPEQSRLDQQDFDTRSDIYSLGVLLYELLTGTPPFDRERLRSVGLEEMLQIIREEDPPRPSTRLTSIQKRRRSESTTQLDVGQTEASTAVTLQSTSKRGDRKRDSQSAKLIRSVRGELDWIVLRAMEKDPNRRYTTPTDLANDIVRFLEGEAVTACPPSPLYRFRKFANRNKTALATSGIVIAALVVGIVGVAYQAVRASRAESEANAAAFEFIIKNVLGSEDAQTSAGYSPDPSLTLLVLLEDARDRIDQRLADQPEIRAKVKATLAGLFNNVGQYDDSVRLYREYLEFLKSKKGPTDADTIRVMQRLVRIYLAESRLSQAESLGNEALRYSRQYLGEEHEVTMLLVNDLATLYHKQGMKQKAVDTYLQVLEVRQRVLGDVHPDTLFTTSNLAEVYDSLGRFEEAERLHQQVFDAYRSTLSPNDPRLAGALNKLGKFRLLRGRRNESTESIAMAAEQLRESLRIYTTNRGAAHLDTLDTKHHLAQAHIELNQLDVARPLLEDVVDQLEGLRRPDSWMSLQAMNMLGWTYLHQSRLTEADYKLRNAYEKLMERHPGDLLTLQVMGNLAIVRYRMGKLDDSVLLDEKTYKLSLELLGPDHLETLATKTRLGLGYLDQGNYDDGRKLLEEAYEVGRDLPGASRIVEALRRSDRWDANQESDPE